MNKVYLKRTKLLVVTFFTVASLWGGDLEVAIGEQPPLLSQAGGIVDMVVAKAMSLGGYEVRFNWLPIGRMLTDLRDDRRDVYVTPSNTPGQQHPHIDVLEARGVFFYKKSKFRTDPVVRLEDLAGKRVATVINSPLRPMLEAAGAVVDEGPFETMFAKLDLGRVDLTATADVGGILSIRKEFPGREIDFSFTDYSYSNIGAGLYVRNRSDLKNILPAFRKGFEMMKANGSLKKMLIDFFGEENWRRVRIR
ncbi:MAG: transporter substrate-binding domain-containing protein [Treponemataceae bacterium]